MSFTEDENFGAQIRAARALLYVTQGELARAARLSVATLNEIEHGKARKRASTREALMQCLTSAGIHFEPNGNQAGNQGNSRAGSHAGNFASNYAQGQLFGVFLQRTARPFRLSASLHNLLAPDALLVPRSILFYLASGSDIQANHSLSFAAELDFPHRRVLLDLVGFDLSPLRVMQLGRFLLSAFSLYGDRLFCSEPARLPTLSQANAEALATLAHCRRRALHDPFPLLFALETANREKIQTAQTASPNYPSLNEASIEDLLRQRDHPLARVKELIEAAQEET